MTWVKAIFLSTKFWGSFIVVAVTLIFYIAIYELSNRYIEKKKGSSHNSMKKKLTLLSLFINILKYILFFVDLIIVLGIFEIQVTAFIATASIITVVVGLALQDLLKDFIAGLFIILDDQYNVGDTVEINKFKGEVTSVGFKSTKVKNYEGDTRIFSNRAITDVINYSKAIVMFTFASDIDLLKVEKILDKLVIKCKEEIEDIIGEIHYKGIEEYKDGKITLKVTADVKPLKQYKIESYIMREAKLLFDKNKIQIK